MNTSFAYGSTFILGAIHALEPGHGSSFIASYLLGEKLTLRHIFTLAFSLLITHFLLLIIIALLMRIVFSHAVFERAEILLSWAGPLIIIAFGTFLVLRHRHSHEEHNLFHSPSACKPAEGNSLRKPAMVGIISGLLPCPTVIAPILMSGAANNFHNAIFYILTYVLGMGAVMLMLMMLFFLMQKALLRKLETVFVRIQPHLISALLIIAVGVAYLVLAIYSALTG